jgi:hypothetical protein
MVKHGYKYVFEHEVFIGLYERFSKAQEGGKFEYLNPRSRLKLDRSEELDLTNR